MLLKFIFFVLSTAYADPANHFVCRSADEKTKVTYSTTSFAGVPMLTYVFEKTSLNFSGPKLKKEQITMGSWTVTDVSAEKKISLFIPIVNIEKGPVEFSTMLAETTVKTGTTSFLQLQCKAEKMVF